MRALPTVPSAPLRAPPCPGAHNRSRGRGGLVALCAVAWRQGFAEAKESRPKRLKVKTLPKDLVGTVYRNAAGRIEIGASRYDHWFDGDGYVFGLSMDGQAQQAAFAGRFVRTERYVAQEAPEARARAERGLGMERMGAWTPARNGDALANAFRIATNPANTSVLWWGERLLALCEGGVPYRLEPGNLETLGEELFTDPKSSDVSFFSAHPKRDGELFNIGLTIGMPPSLEVYRCSLQGQLLKRAKLPLKEFAFIHDFALTESYVVLLIPPWVLPVSGLVSSLWEGGMGRKFEWQEALGTRCVLLRREDLEVVFDETLMPPVSFYHTVNAYEEGDEVRVQVAGHNGPRQAVEENFKDMLGSQWSDETRCSLQELTLDLKSKSVKLSAVGPSDASAFELPSIHPSFVGRRQRHVFTNAAYPSTAAFTKTVERLDLEQGTVDRAPFKAHEFAGEPMLLPKANQKPLDELNAYVCTCVYDAEKDSSYFAFLDAGHLSQGPVAEVHLPTRVPYSFHGEWIEGRLDVLDAALR